MSKRIGGFTKTILIGRLGHNPVAKGKTAASFPVLNTVFENGKEVIQSHTVLVFGKQKDVCMKHLTKGDLCCIEGKLDTESPAILAERITFLSTRAIESRREEVENER